MSNFFKVVLIILSSITFLAGCGGSSSGSADDDNNQRNKPTPTNRVNWSTVPTEYNPKTEDVEFRTSGYEKINIDAFGFKDDVEVIYTNEVPAASGFLRLFKVYKDSASWGSLQPRSNGTTLDLKSYGTYKCSIRITNGQITDLQGGCYVRLQVFLPVGSEIEVYNVGELITKRFIPISAEDFLKQLDNTNRAADKFAVIESFLESYNGMNKKPSLTAKQLGIVVDEFFYKEEKFKVLQRLHSIVSDRENLGKMIEDEFNYFDRDEARRIVGL